MGVAHVKYVRCVDVLVERFLDQILRLVARQLGHSVERKKRRTAKIQQLPSLL